tara:strand:- start:1208 stop:2059 length:852 start_codon:yes stop_codon:yes gene_type:complete
MDGVEDDDGCPDLDNDGDGIEDQDDRCPDEAEDLDGHRDRDGCPELDNDYDGIEDSSDACPLSKEDKDGFEDHDGCPEEDNDGDGIADLDDYCPDAVGGGGPTGCPDDIKAVVRGDKIVILEKIHFKSDRAVIVGGSLEVLDAVRDRLIENPQLLKIRVEGHTDERADASYNLRLSQQRAEAVVAHLVKEGVAASRLEAVGYGESRRLSEQSTQEGRAMNRRVEFSIIQVQEVIAPVPETREPAKGSPEPGAGQPESVESPTSSEEPEEPSADGLDDPDKDPS